MGIFVYLFDLIWLENMITSLSKNKDNICKLDSKTEERRMSLLQKKKKKGKLKYKTNLTNAWAIIFVSLLTQLKKQETKRNAKSKESDNLSIPIFKLAIKIVHTNFGLLSTITFK